MPRSNQLAAYLSEAARRPFDWDGDDCCIFVADWVMLVRGVDPAADFRGRYKTRIGAARKLNAAGGLPGVFARTAALLDLGLTASPVAGDIGIVPVRTPKGLENAAAICTGPRWAVRSIRGVASLPAAPVSAWSL